jgi:hypothetical protein
MSAPLIDVLGGLSDIGGHLLELYRLRRDGTFFEQQQFLSELRIAEAAAADERTIERDQELAKIRVSDALTTLEGNYQLDIRRAQLDISMKQELDRRKRVLESSPFEQDAEEVHSVVARVTEGGRRPALLIAPFYRDRLSQKENDDAPHAFRLAIRRSWLASPWAQDLVPLDGIISRPLKKTDLDIMVIQQVLHDLPVILICGEIQGDRRVWTTLTAWNLAESTTVPSIQVHLPALQAPSLDDHGNNESERLKFEDYLGRAVTLIIGTFGDWFHVVHYARRPHVHLGLPKDSHERRCCL